MPININQLPNHWLKIIVEVCRDLPAEYFNVPVGGGETTRTYERVYCYELYHQFRCRLGRLTAERPKGNHPHWRDHLHNMQPDFLYYDEEGQYFSIQVKPAGSVSKTRYQSGTMVNVVHDLLSLRKLASPPSSYQCNVLLVYGELSYGFPRRNLVPDWMNNHAGNLPIYVLWHRIPGSLLLLSNGVFEEIVFQEN